MQITLKTFVQTNSGVAAKPGASQKNVRFNHVPSESPATNPNAAIFVAGVGAIVVEIQNATPELAAQLPEGTAIDVVLNIPD